MASDSSKKRIDPLAMQIYAALLGSSPKVARQAPTQTRLKFQVRVEAKVHTTIESPFHSPTLKENIERAAAGAVNALSDASERLRRSRAKVQRSAHEPVRAPDLTPPTPIVLIGPASARAAQRSAARRSAAA